MISPAPTCAFVIYAKGDVGDDELDRKAVLDRIEALVVRTLGPAFIDEIHNAGGTHQAVAAALQGATSFCIVRGDGYRKREWTRWEFDAAVARGLPMYEVTLPEMLLRQCADESSRGEARARR